MVDHQQKTWDVVILDDLNANLLQKVSDFLSSFLPEGADPVWSSEYFKWKLHRNPAGRGFLSCAVNGDEVVGTASITLKRIWYDGRVVVGGETGDTYSHPDFRKRKKNRSPSTRPKSPTSQAEYLKKSIFGRLVYENTSRAFRDGVQIIYGTPNENSRLGYEKRLNFKSHPVKDKSLYRPSALGICTNQKATFFFNTLLGRFVYGMIENLEWLIESIIFQYWKKRQKNLGYSVEKADKATADFDQLWETCKHEKEFSLVRDRLYFQHRFVDNPLVEYNIYECRKDGVLCGAMVTRICSLSREKKYCYIADWLFDESREFIFPIMLAHAIHDNYLKDIHAFVVWAGETMAHISDFCKFGFFSTSTRIPIIFYLSNKGKKIIETQSCLDFTIASSDNI